MSHPDAARRAAIKRVKAQIKLHAGHEPWGINDGSLVSLLEGWGLHPAGFLESLDSWGYEIRVRETVPA